MATSRVEMAEAASATHPESARVSGATSDDKRLERLFDYTKWHMSIYLSAGGGLVAAVSVAADKTSFVARLVGWPLGLFLALIAMFVAGAAGGIVASSATLYRTFEEVWDEPLGPFGWRWFPGRVWANIEHLSFWVSIMFLFASVLSAPAVLSWITGS